MIGSEGVYIQ